MRSLMIFIAAYVMSCGAARAQEVCPTGPFATDPHVIAAAITAHPVWSSDWEVGANMDDVPPELTEGGYWYQAGGLLNYGGVMSRYDAKRYVIVNIQGWWGDTHGIGMRRRPVIPLVNQAVEQIGGATYTITVTRPTPVEARHFACLANRFLVPTAKPPGKDPTCPGDDAFDPDGHISEAALLHEGRQLFSAGLSCAKAADLFDSMDRLIENVVEEAEAQAAGTWRPAFVNHLATDARDNLYLLLDPGTAAHGFTDIFKIAPSGKLSHLSAYVDDPLVHPVVFTVDGHGHPWVSEARSDSATIYDAAGETPADGDDWQRESSNPKPTLISGPVNAIAIDARNHLYVLSATAVLEITPSGAVSPYASLAAFSNSKGAPDWPASIVVAADGTLFVSQPQSHVILTVSPQKVVSILAGSVGTSGMTDGPARKARFDSPRGLALDGAGALYVADYGNDKIRRITPDGQVSTVGGGWKAGLRLNRPSAVAVDSAGTLYVLNGTYNRIQKITVTGVVTTLDAQPFIDAR